MQYKFSEINQQSLVTVIMRHAMPDYNDTVVGKYVQESIKKTYNCLSELGCTVIGDWANAAVAMQEVAFMFANSFAPYVQEFLETYAGMTRLTLTPSTDSATRVKTHEGSDGSIAENSPINASMDVINNPYVKAKGVSRYTDEEIITNDTVDEAAQRVQVLARYRLRIDNVVQACLYRCCDEMTTAY